MTKSRPLIVCLCGSTKFKALYFQANKDETYAGKIVLSVGFFGHADKEPLTEKTKEFLDLLHLEKIRLADEVLILDYDGYIDKSTSREIAYAQLLNKKVRYWSKEND
jgi:hypothetical protein